MVGWHVLSRPSAAEGGGRRPAFTGLATSHTRPPTEVDGWQHKLSRVSQNRAAVQRVGRSRAIDLRTVDRHPPASVGTLVLGLRCSWCPDWRRCRARAGRAATGDDRESLFVITPALKKPSHQEERSRPRGGLGLRPGPALWEERPHLSTPSALSSDYFTRIQRGCRSRGYRAASPKSHDEAEDGTTFQGGALGRGRAHRPSGPSSKCTPGAGADARRWLRGAAVGRRTRFPYQVPHLRP
jgi:hypothetical protein